MMSFILVDRASLGLNCIAVQEMRDLTYHIEEDTQP